MKVWNFLALACAISALIALAAILTGCTKDPDVTWPPEPIPAPDPVVEELLPYDPVEVQSDWYDVIYVEPRTYIIREPQSTEGNVCYLLLGTEKALMIDAGTGEAPLVNGSRMRHVIDQITDLPLHLMLSHFHYDHIQNLAEFEHVVFPEIDYLIAGTSADSIYQLSPAETLSSNTPAEIQVAEWWPLQTPIDLGARTIRLIHLPGHSNSSVAILDDDRAMAFLGDFLYNGSLFVFGANQFPAYEASTDLLLANSDSNYALYGAHGPPLVAYNKLETLAEFWDCIASGECLGIGTIFWGEQVTTYSFGGLSLVVF